MAKVKKIKSNKSEDVHQAIRHFGVLIEAVNDNVALLAEQQGDIKKTLNSHTEMIGRLAVNLEIVKEDVEFIKSGLKRKVDVEEFSALEKRVAVLEKRR